MPTTLLTLPAGETTMRWREPFITGGLNAQAAVVRPAGIYRGFRLAGTGTNHELQVTADTGSGDHIAVYRTAAGYAVTVRRIGTFTLSLAALASQTVVVALYATYAIGATSATQIRAYTIAEYNGASEQPELIVLGTVVVPAAAPITSLSYDRRRVAYQAKAPGAREGAPLVRNGNFEAGWATDPNPLGATFWEKAVTVGTATWAISTTSALQGARSLAFAYTSGPATGTVRQYINAPVRTTQLLRLTYAYRVNTASTGGTLTIQVDYTDSAGALQAGTPIAIPINSVTGGWINGDTTFAVPAGAVHVRAVLITATAVTFGGTGETFFLDAIQVVASDLADGEQYPFEDAVARLRVASGLVLEDPTEGSSWQQGTYLRHAANALSGERGLVGSDKVGTGGQLLNWLGRLVLGQGLLGSAANARTARLAPFYSATHTYTLLFQSAPDSAGTATSRLYLRSNGRVYLTVNASFDGTNWNRDVTATGSSLTLIDGLSRRQYEHNSALGDAWADTFASGTWNQTAGVEGAATSFGSMLAGSLTLGSMLLDTEANSLLPRIAATFLAGAGQERTLMLRFTPSVSGPAVRVYAFNGGSDPHCLEVTTNAAWDSGTSEWAADDAAMRATRCRIGAFQTSSLYLQTHAPGAATWADGGFAAVAEIADSTGAGVPKNASLTDGIFRAVSPSVGGGTNPTPTAASIQRNSVYGLSMLKAWGSVTTGGGSPVIDEGFGLASVAYAGSTVQVTLRSAVELGYAPTVTCESIVVAVPVVLRTSTTTFIVRWFEEVAGVLTLVNLSAEVRSFVFHVHGRHL